MRSSFSSLLRSLAPFAAVFFLLQFIVRLVLSAREWADMPHAPLALLKILSTGLMFDIGVFVYFAAVVALFSLLLPARLQGTTTQRNLLRGVFFLFGFVLLFTAVSEWFFWDEFRARFNFIAVDYLVYTHEVIGNIRESYPVGPVIAAIAALALGLTVLVRPTPRPAPAFTWKNRAAAFVATIAIAAIVFAGLKSDYADIGDNHYANEIAKNGTYELFSAFRNNNLSYNRFYRTLPENEATNRLSELLTHNPAQAHPVAPGGTEEHYNVVLVTIESMSASFMEAFGNTQKLTPNMDKLANESLFFTNLYATGTRTVYGLAATSLGMPPLAGNAIVRRPNNEGLFTLGSLLNSKGYSSKFIYGGFGYFDNMNQYFRSNGYQIVDRNDLAADEKNFANVWGVSDEDLFTRVLRENDKAYAENRPFFDHVMTTSNHRPFTYPDGRIDIPSHSGRAGAVKYTDYAIGKFLAEARTKPWFDKTIFVITADHTAGSAGKAELDPAGYHIPMMIYAPKLITPQRIDTLTSQIDIPPTVLGLMKMRYESKFWGQDAVATPPHRAFISNYQQLGYLTDTSLTVLKPVKQVDFYRKNGKDFQQQPQPDDALLRDAISYYQSANHWRDWHNADTTPPLASQTPANAPAAR